MKRIHTSRLFAGAFACLLSANVAANQTFITGNLLGKHGDSESKFSEYIDNAGPLMLDSGLEVALLDVVKTSEPAFIESGDIVGITIAEPGGMQTLFANEKFQTVMPILQQSLRGHWGYPLGDASLKLGSLEKDKHYVLLARPTECSYSADNLPGYKMAGSWKPMTAPNQPVALTSIELWVEEAEAQAEADFSNLSCEIAAGLRLRDKITG